MYLHKLKTNLMRFYLIVLIRDLAVILKSIFDKSRFGIRFNKLAAKYAKIFFPKIKLEIAPQLWNVLVFISTAVDNFFANFKYNISYRPWGMLKYHASIYYFFKYCTNLPWNLLPYGSLLMLLRTSRVSFTSIFRIYRSFFFVKGGLTNFHLFKWSVYWILSILYTGFLYFYKIILLRKKAIHLPALRSDSPWYISKAFFYFFEEGGAFSRFPITKKISSKNLRLERLGDKTYPSMFKIALKHDIFKKQAVFKHNSLNNLKRLYKSHVILCKHPANILFNTAGHSVENSMVFFVNFYRNVYVNPNYFYQYYTNDGWVQNLSSLSLFLNSLNSNSKNKLNFSFFLFNLLFLTTTAPAAQILPSNVLTNTHTRTLNFKKKNFFKKIMIIKQIKSQNAAEIYSKFWGNLTKQNIFGYIGEYATRIPVKIEPQFKQFLKFFWPTRYNPANFYKFNDLVYNDDNTNFFLRKNKIFNKSRYSRNRQLYRTGVYMCLFVNVIFVYFYFFSFYRFAFVFSYLWFGIGLFVISMVLGRAMKYRFYNFSTLAEEVDKFITWFGFFLTNSWEFVRKSTLYLINVLGARLILARLLFSYLPLKRKTKKNKSKRLKALFDLNYRLNYYFYLYNKHSARLATKLPRNFAGFWLCIYGDVQKNCITNKRPPQRPRMSQKILNRILHKYIVVWRRQNHFHRI